MQTLDTNMKNRGLLFAKEMVPYCGKTSRVLKEVKRIINEANGEMIVFNTRSYILEEVICASYISDKRLFCPRSMYPYWKEIWLKRA
jgi:multimeric flavodoxin WrbA